MKSLIILFLYFLFSVSIFSQSATKQDIQILMQQMDKRFEQMDKRFEQMQKQIDKRFEQMDKRFEQMQKQIDRRFKQLREEMNERFEQMNRRFELLTHIMYWVMGILSTLIIPLYFLIWKQHQKPNIYQLEQQIYQSEPEIKARIYLHLKKQAEEYKTSIS